MPLNQRHEYFGKSELVESAEFWPPSFLLLTPPRNRGGSMASGKIKWFDNKKGFGFIADDAGQDVFVHHSSILGSGYKTLNEGEPVTFEAVASDKGLKAQNVQRVRPT